MSVSLPKQRPFKSLDWNWLLCSAFWLVVTSYLLIRLRWDSLDWGKLAFVFLFSLATGYSTWRLIESANDAGAPDGQRWSKLAQYLQMRFAPEGKPFASPLRFIFFPGLLLYSAIDNSSAVLANPIALLCIVYIATLIIQEVVRSKRLKAFAASSPYSRGVLRWLGEASSHATNQEFGVSVHPLIGDQGERVATARDSILDKMASLMGNVEHPDPNSGLRARAIRNIEEATIEALLAGHPYVRGATERLRSFQKRMKATSPILAVKRMEAYTETMKRFEVTLEEALHSENSFNRLESAIHDFEALRLAQRNAGGSHCSLPEELFATTLPTNSVES